MKIEEYINQVLPIGLANNDDWTVSLWNYIKGSDSQLSIYENVFNWLLNEYGWERYFSSIPKDSDFVHICRPATYKTDFHINDYNIGKKFVFCKKICSKNIPKSELPDFNVGRILNDAKEKLSGLNLEYNQVPIILDFPLDGFGSIYKKNEVALEFSNPYPGENVEDIFYKYGFLFHADSSNCENGALKLESEQIVDVNISDEFLKKLDQANFNYSQQNNLKKGVNYHPLFILIESDEPTDEQNLTVFFEKPLSSSAGVNRGDPLPDIENSWSFCFGANDLTHELKLILKDTLFEKVVGNIDSAFMNNSNNAEYNERFSTDNPFSALISLKEKTRSSSMDNQGLLSIKYFRLKRNSKILLAAKKNESLGLSIKYKDLIKFAHYAYGNNNQRRAQIVNKGNTLSKNPDARKQATSQNAIMGNSAGNVFKSVVENASNQEQPDKPFLDDWKIVKDYSINNVKPENIDYFSSYYYRGALAQEWCHLMGYKDSLSSERANRVANLVSGSYSCNTEQLAIETGQRKFTFQTNINDLRLRTTAYLICTNNPHNVFDLSNDEYWIEMQKLYYKRYTDSSNKVPKGPQSSSIVPLAIIFRYKILKKEKKIFDHYFEAQSEYFDKNLFSILVMTIRLLIEFEISNYTEFKEFILSDGNDNEDDQDVDDLYESEDENREDLSDKSGNSSDEDDIEAKSLNKKKVKK